MLGALHARAPDDRPAADDDVIAREAAAHDKRNWVRLTYDCNDRCIFCLDSRAHDGEMRDPEDVKRQILDGRRKGATRLILSGGEPTIHPRFVDFVRLGRLAGYPRIQTVTNGRLFAYKDFLTRAVDAGLGEITFSIHGPNAKIHDALVGVPGAFEQEVAGLDHALADGRVIVNIDVCVNRGNVRQLPALIETFVARGVREFDLLHIIPFGRAYTDGKEILFYDLAEMQPYLQQAFAWARQPDMHIWLNRFPPAHCEGFEDLIQDPYKFNDEVRGRQEEYELLLERGQPLHCRAPEQCRHCYLQPLCDTLDDVRATAKGRFEVLRVDTRWEASLPPAYGGDPASAKRAAAMAAAGAAAGTDAGTDATGATTDGKRRLPLVGQGRALEPRLAPPALAVHGGATVLELVAPTLAEARAAAAAFDGAPQLALELDDYAGLAEALTGAAPGVIDGRRVVRAVARDVAQAEQLLAIDAGFEVVVPIARGTEAWLLGLAPVPARLVVRQPNHELRSDAVAHDVDLAGFFARFTAEVPIENVPACLLGAGRTPRPAPARVDTAMMRPDGRLEIFRYARRYIAEHFYARSLRCDGCREAARCPGMHVNWIRAHGFAPLQPIAP
ncbi:MAG: radical SAM protein [Kofleriaceae bacterium]|nr:radical SAM protein [Kofleriaceae bacterium]